MIYFDMDGVLADFDRGVNELCGFTPDAQGGGRDADDRLFAAIRKVDHFFRKLKPVDGAKELFADVHKRYGDRCKILTAIPKKERGITDAAEDKIDWVRKNLSEEVSVYTVSRKEKKNYCFGPEDVLIDDYQKNIDEWEQAGGTGILFTDAKTVIRKLKEAHILNA